jgi:ribulose-5-phosphate 4-epimerase/fuculose-1-phosphate aldolase
MSETSRPPTPDETALRADLAIANRILVRQGVVDAFGHVSARHPTRPDRFLLARNMAPASVTPDDILEFELDGTPVISGGPKVYLERFIHGEIFRARPDVMGVVHTHSPAVIPFSVV